MTPVLYVAIALAALSLILVLVVALIALRRRTPDDATRVPALVQQIETVREEVRALSELFLVPRTRGVVGEQLLADLLASWLPAGSYELQHSFGNGTRVDAVVRLGSRLVPVDSKFPLEAARRFFARSGGEAGSPVPADLRKALQKHITDIASRYINPAEGTMSFALMYIPAERVYVDLFAAANEELMRSALEQNVVPVSPSTLFLYLQTVAYGLRGLSIPERTRALLDNLAALGNELTALTRSFEVAGGHLRNLSRAFDESASRLHRVELRAERLTDTDHDE